MSKLILTRKTNESLMIGDDAKITVTRIRGNRVSLLIEAPECVPVNRQEVYDAIKRNKRLTGDGPAE